MRTIIQKIRNALLSGVLVAVPFAVTLWVISVLSGFLQRPGVWLLQSALTLVPEQFVGIVSAVEQVESALGILLGLLLLLALGFTTKNYLGNKVLNGWEQLMAKVPVLSTVYSGVKQLMEAMFSSKKAAFEKVVLVQWPRKGIYSMGFHTGTGPIETPSGDTYINVFLPTTPNPTTGFYFIVRDDEVIHTDLSVEDGFKMLISAGIVAPSSVLSAPDPVGVAQFDPANWKNSD